MDCRAGSTSRTCLRSTVKTSGWIKTNETCEDGLARFNVGGNCHPVAHRYLVVVVDRTTRWLILRHLPIFRPEKFRAVTRWHTCCNKVVMNTLTNNFEERIMRNETRLIMAKNSNAKIISKGDATIYRIGNTIVDDKGNLVTGTDAELWDAYRLAN